MSTRVWIREAAAFAPSSGVVTEPRDPIDLRSPELVRDPPRTRDGAARDPGDSSPRAEMFESPPVEIRAPDPTRRDFRSIGVRYVEVSERLLRLTSAAISGSDQPVRVPRGTWGASPPSLPTARADRGRDAAPDATRPATAPSSSSSSSSSSSAAASSATSARAANTRSSPASSAVKGLEVSADYLFPYSAVMRRRPSREAKFEAVGAMPRGEAFDEFVWSPYAHAARRSGEGVDREVGWSAGVMLGAWSCCRNVTPQALGCVTDTQCNHALLHCVQCGIWYDPVENARQEARGVRACSYHPQEPEAARGAGAPFIDAVWPCCNAVGFANSKYASATGGKPSEYLDRPASAWSWGCTQGHHRPAIPSLESTGPHDPPANDIWVATVLQATSPSAGARAREDEERQGWIAALRRKHDGDRGAGTGGGASTAATAVTAGGGGAAAASTAAAAAAAAPTSATSPRARSPPRLRAARVPEGSNPRNENELPLSAVLDVPGGRLVLVRPSSGRAPTDPSAVAEWRRLTWRACEEVAGAGTVVALWPHVRGAVRMQAPATTGLFTVATAGLQPWAPTTPTTAPSTATSLNASSALAGSSAAHPTRPLTWLQRGAAPHGLTQRSLASSPSSLVVDRFRSRVAVTAVAQEAGWVVEFATSAAAAAFVRATQRTDGSAPAAHGSALLANVWEQGRVLLLERWVRARGGASGKGSARRHSIAGSAPSARGGKGRSGDRGGVDSKGANGTDGNGPEARSDDRPAHGPMAGLSSGWRRAAERVWLEAEPDTTLVDTVARLSARLGVSPAALWGRVHMAGGRWGSSTPLASFCARCGSSPAEPGRDEASATSSSPTTTTPTSSSTSSTSSTPSSSKPCRFHPGFWCALMRVRQVFRAGQTTTTKQPAKQRLEGIPAPLTLQASIGIPPSLPGPVSRNSIEPPWAKLLCPMRIADLPAVPVAVTPAARAAPAPLPPSLPRDAPPQPLPTAGPPSTEPGRPRAPSPRAPSPPSARREATPRAPVVEEPPAGPPPPDPIHRGLYPRKMQLTALPWPVAHWDFRRTRTRADEEVAAATSVPAPFPAQLPGLLPLPVPWDWVQTKALSDGARYGGPMLAIPPYIHRLRSRRKRQGASSAHAGDGDDVVTRGSDRGSRATGSGGSRGGFSVYGPGARLTLPFDLPVFHPPPLSVEHNARIGVLWLPWAPPVPSTLPALVHERPAIQHPTTYPAFLPVDDGHRLRRVYPTLELDVMNRSNEPIAVSIFQHFAEVDDALDFDRRRAYGYRLFLPVGTVFFFRPHSLTTVTIAAADPNFLSKTMMAPVSLHWRDPKDDEWEELTSGPRKRWFPRDPPGLPAPGASRDVPFPRLALYPPPPPGLQPWAIPRRRLTNNQLIQSAWDPAYVKNVGPDGTLPGSSPSWGAPIDALSELRAASSRLFKPRRPRESVLERSRRWRPRPFGTEGGGDAEPDAGSSAGEEHEVEEEEEGRMRGRGEARGEPRVGAARGSHARPATAPVHNPASMVTAPSAFHRAARRSESPPHRSRSTSPPMMTTGELSSAARPRPTTMTATPASRRERPSSAPLRGRMPSSATPARGASPTSTRVPSGTTAAPSSHVPFTSSSASSSSSATTAVPPVSSTGEHRARPTSARARVESNPLAAPVRPARHSHHHAPSSHEAPSTALPLMSGAGSALHPRVRETSGDHTAGRGYVEVGAGMGNEKRPVSAGSSSHATTVARPESARTATSSSALPVLSVGQARARPSSVSSAASGPRAPTPLSTARLADLGLDEEGQFGDDFDQLADAIEQATAGTRRSPRSSGAGGSGRRPASSSSSSSSSRRAVAEPIAETEELEEEGGRGGR